MGDKYSSMAIVSFVSSILGLFSWLITWIYHDVRLFYRILDMETNLFFLILGGILVSFAIIFGIIALINIKKKNMKGGGLAIAGIVIGIVVLFLSIISFNRALSVPVLVGVGGPI